MTQLFLVSCMVYLNDSDCSVDHVFPYHIRLERHAPVSVEMVVLPSLSVAASVLPSYSRRGEYVLSLEATNYRSSGDDASDSRHLRIHKVSKLKYMR